MYRYEKAGYRVIRGRALPRFDRHAANRVRSTMACTGTGTGSRSGPGDLPRVVPMTTSGASDAGKLRPLDSG